MNLESNGHNEGFINNQDVNYIGLTNMLAQAFLSGVKEEDGYADSEDAQIILSWLGVNPESINQALEATEGQVKDYRYINERMED
tara:strand:+ start:156 stop:410 length:255 start_codon:yes stop_codon:yes gene_type:complete